MTGLPQSAHTQRKRVDVRVALNEFLARHHHRGLASAKGFTESGGDLILTLCTLNSRHGFFFSVERKESPRRQRAATVR